MVFYHWRFFRSSHRVGLTHNYCIPFKHSIQLGYQSMGSACTQNQSRLSNQPDSLFRLQTLYSEFSMRIQTLHSDSLIKWVIRSWVPLTLSINDVQLHLSLYIQLCKPYGPFIWIGFNCFKPAEPLIRESLIFTKKFLTKDITLTLNAIFPRKQCYRKLGAHKETHLLLLVTDIFFYLMTLLQLFI